MNAFAHSLEPDHRAGNKAFITHPLTPSPVDIMHHFNFLTLLTTLLLSWVLLSCTPTRTDSFSAQVNPLSTEQATEYNLDSSFFKKGTMVQDILIATSDQVADVTIIEAAYQFDLMMSSLDLAIAQRIRNAKVLCVLVGYKELTSDVPFFKSDKTGEELDFYNWRQRGFLTKVEDRSVVLFAEEDVMEYEGGMQKESILIHEFGHVIHRPGFLPGMDEELKTIFKNAQDKGRYQDGYAAQRFGRIDSETPVSLLDALQKSFPDISRDLLVKCLNGGDILVNEKPTNAEVKVTKKDKVKIVFGGPKSCYAIKNRAEYFAEGVQAWFDTNRTMDHDHNHIHTREQLLTYDPELAQFCKRIFGMNAKRFVSPRLRAGTGHLADYDPATAPKVEDLPHIRTAALNYYDTYWKDYWQRLRDKYKL